MKISPKYIFKHSTPSRAIMLLKRRRLQGVKVKKNKKTGDGKD